jgi:hypothetical protein
VTLTAPSATGIHDTRYVVSFPEVGVFQFAAVQTDLPLADDEGTGDVVMPHGRSHQSPDCTVTVVLAQRSLLRAVAKFAVFFFLIALCVGLVTANASRFFSGFHPLTALAGSSNQNVSELESILFNEVAPWIVLAVILVILAVVIYLVTLCYTPSITSFGQGYGERSQRIACVVAGGLYFALAVVVIVLWTFFLRVNKGYAEIFDVLDDGIVTTLKTTATIRANLDYVVTSTTALNISLPSATPQLLGLISDADEKSRPASRIGYQIMRIVMFFIAFCGVAGAGGSGEAPVAGLPESQILILSSATRLSIADLVTLLKGYRFRSSRGPQHSGSLNGIARMACRTIRYMQLRLQRPGTCAHRSIWSSRTLSITIPMTTSTPQQ